MEKNGSIVNAASVAGLKPNPNLFAYGVSKAAVLSMTKSAAREGGERNIRVNAIAP
jgi:NAD(P)-dependent dehydrogenase (short-subunit alcohol dehydrogenase family)